MNIKFSSLLFIVFAISTSCATFVSCSKTDKDIEPIDECNLSALTVSEKGNYDFSSDIASHFSQSTRWESNNADISIAEGKGLLTAQSDDVSSALEAWKLYKKAMPYNKSWQISVEINLPLYWNTNGGKKAQVGAGIFVGKPVKSGQSAKVYECNMAAINGGMRFVQAQLVANRLGDDPIDVQHAELSKNKEKAVLKIEFCAKNKALSLYIDNKKVGKSVAINEKGLDNWKMKENSTFDIGIMGFVENTVITNNQPALDNFEYRIY